MLARDPAGPPFTATSRTVGSFAAARFALPGPVLISARRREDKRAFFLETYSARDFADLGITELFLQDNHPPHHG